jgi:hypothetical protein
VDADRVLFGADRRGAGEEVGLGHPGGGEGVVGAGSGRLGHRGRGLEKGVKIFILHRLAGGFCRTDQLKLISSV